MGKRRLTAISTVLVLAGSVAAQMPVRPLGHEQISAFTTNAYQQLEYGALLEVESFASRMGGESESDIILATVAFDVETALNDWIRGHLGLLWEEGSREDENVDEGFIMLGASEKIPFYLVAGRFYQPVGNFESAFVSDPLTLELIEMNRTAGMVGYDRAGLAVNVGVFQGDTKAGFGPGEGGDSTLSDFFASATLTPVNELKFGAYWLSDLMETYNYGSIGDQVADQPGYQKNGAAGAFLNAFLGRFTFNAEYVSALNDYSLAGGRYLPSAFNLEASASVTERVTAGLKFEGSNDLYAAYDRVLASFDEKFPGQAYGVVVAYTFYENAAVAAEYLHLEKLSGNESGDLVTVQLAFEI